MKKKILLVIFIVIIFIVLIKVIIELNYPGSSAQIAAGKVADSITYEIHNNYSQGGFDYSKRGYYVNTYKMPDSPWFYIITMGKQSSGGYSIEISEVKINKNNDVEVIVKENSPKSGEIVTMAFTYPAVCLELNKMPNSIKIINTNGEVFEALNWN